MTWTDIIVGGLIVKEARKDSKYGAEDLRYFEWICWGLGGMIPVIIGPTIMGLGFMLNVSTNWYAVTLVPLFLIPFALRLKQTDEDLRVSRNLR